MIVRNEKDWQTRIYRFRAACYEAMGLDEKAEADYDKAIEELKKALELDPDYTEVAELLEALAD